MKLVTPWKYNLLAPLIPKRWKPAIRQYVMVHAVKHDMYPVPERDIFPIFIKPGDTVIDVGANIGAYTKVFSQIVGPSGKVWAFEPITPTFCILSKATQHLANVERRQWAMSSYSGVGCMRLLRGDETVGELSLFRSTLEKIWLGDSSYEFTEDVRLGRLDEAGFGFPTFIKCDAEGHDWHVIIGAEETINRCRPVWMVEINEEPAHSPIVTYFRETGYTMWHNHGAEHLAPSRVGELSYTQNYFFVPKEKLKSLGLE